MNRKRLAQMILENAFLNKRQDGTDYAILAAFVLDGFEENRSARMLQEILAACGRTDRLPPPSKNDEEKRARQCAINEVLKLL